MLGIEDTVPLRSRLEFLELEINRLNEQYEHTQAKLVEAQKLKEENIILKTEKQSLCNQLTDEKKECDQLLLEVQSLKSEKVSDITLSTHFHIFSFMMIVFLLTNFRVTK